jgi:hypothetical protein
MPPLSTELEAALVLFMSEAGIDREEALRRILTDWLGAKHYLVEDTAAIDADPKQTVQYPEFMDDASGGAGG